MDDAIITQAILVFWGMLFAGLILGGLLGWLKGMMWGVAIGCLLIGMGGFAGAGWLGWHRYQSLIGTETVEGVLVDVVTETSRDSAGRTSESRSPIVRFKTLDGSFHQVKGLGGSQSDHAPGDAVSVRYQVDHPSQALVGDFQNLWGGVWGLGMFGAIPSMMGLFFLATAISESGEKRPLSTRARAREKMQNAPPGAQRRRAGKWLIIMANVVFLGTFGVSFLGQFETGESIALTFMVIGVACALYIVAHFIAGRGGWQTPAILLLIGVSFVLFGFGAYMIM